MVAQAQLVAGIRRRVRKLGWDVVRYPGAVPGERRSRLVATNSVDLIVDVGANTGQYAGDLRDFGYGGRILSIEPMQSAFDALRVKASTDDAWDVLHSAVGSKSGEATINVAGNSISSSILPMSERHETVAPHSRYVATETVPLARLDNLARNWVENARRPFLKIDTQGYESAVLEGSEGIFKQIVGVELEMSLVQLYEGQWLLMETIDWMTSKGFKLTGLTSGLWDERTGETLQVDGIFFR